jgi:branched-subunit amino acid transport protein
MDDKWLVIAGMTAATFLPRVVPMLLLPGMKLPKPVQLWLSMIAPAIISALLLPELIVDRTIAEVPVLSFVNTYMLAAIPAFITAVLTKSLLGTVVTGIAAAAFLRIL